MPHRAVRAIASDDVLERAPLRSSVVVLELDFNVFFSLLERRKAYGAFNLEPEFAEMLGQQPLGLVLWEPKL
jgi:hypothetical protein